MTLLDTLLGVETPLTVPSARTVVLVEGISDRLAVEELARRCGRDLAAEGVAVTAIGGSKNAGTFLERFGPAGMGLRLAGLCDAAEESDFRRGLERAGLGADLSRTDMERRGFYVCVADLEDELIRALGVEAVEACLESQGELAAFRSMQRQPAWRGRSGEAQLRRFMGTRGGRKIRAAPLLVGALDLDRVPRPLERLLAYL